jgi:hypothetical protein
MSKDIWPSRPHDVDFGSGVRGGYDQLPAPPPPQDSVKTSPPPPPPQDEKK